MECAGEACLPGPRCDVDRDCDDGLVCNGTELCGTVSRRCVSGIPLDCDDGIACTVDLCAEPGGSCTSQPRDSLCSGAEVCAGIEGTGCIRACDPGVTCDPVAACGCAPELACTYGATGVAACGPAGALEHGERCSAPTDCVAGAQCVPRVVFGGAAGSYSECRVLCRAEGDCPGGAACEVELAGTTTTAACARSCNLVTQAGCESPAGCHPVGFPASTAYADCVVAGARPAGASCGTTGAICAAGLICVTQDTGGGICDVICRVDRDCPGTLRCVTLLEPLVVAGAEYGVCN
jgi:hypothetical protein